MAEIFSGIWDEVKNSETAHLNVSVPVNFSTAERFRGNANRALKIVNEALWISPDSSDLKRQKAMLLLEADDPQGACEQLATIDQEKDPKIALLYAKALSEVDKFEEALQQVDHFLSQKHSNEDLLIATGLHLRLIAKSEGGKKVNKSIEKTVEKFPDSILIRVDAALAFKDCGFINEAREQVKSAKGLFGYETKYREKFLVADIAYQLEDYEEALTIYRELVECYANSLPLRRLLVCLFECDQRKEALNLLCKIPQDIRNLSFFRRMAAAINVRIGDLDSALREIEDYLALEPDDLIQSFF